MKIELHSHTTASDGKLTIKQLIDQAVEEEVCVLAVTDHDTIESFSELEDEISDKIRLIKGIEISAREEENPIHILGYNIDLENKNIVSECEKVKLARYKEIRRVVDKLSVNVSENINLKDIIKKTGEISMDSIAEYLYMMGFSDSKKDSKEKYLSKGKCAYVQKKCMEPAKAIALIKEAGGIAILAHPHRIKADNDKKKKIIESLIKKGLDGIEIYCRGMNDTDYYLEICEKNNLLISGGSDFHNIDTKLGYYTETKLIPSNLSILPKIL